MTLVGYGCSSSPYVLISVYKLLDYCYSTVTLAQKITGLSLGYDFADDLAVDLEH